MKTEIKYTTTSGDHHVVLVSGAIDDGKAAKQELANKLNLPRVDQPPGAGEDIDSQLRHAQIEPSSVKARFIAE